MLQREVAADGTLIIGKPGTGQRHVGSTVACQATLQEHDVRCGEADTEFPSYAVTTQAEQAAVLRAWLGPDLLLLDGLFLAPRISKPSAESSTKHMRSAAHQRYKWRTPAASTHNPTALPGGV